MNGTHLLLVHTNDVNILGENINTIKKNKDALVEGNREVGLEANTKYVYGKILPPKCRTKSRLTDS